jgi:hypothetical protein
MLRLLMHRREDEKDGARKTGRVEGGEAIAI